MGCLVNEYTQELKAKPAQRTSEPVKPHTQYNPALALHSHIGNQAFGARIQASLKVSSSTDAHEREATRVSQQLVSILPMRSVCPPITTTTPSSSLSLLSSVNSSKSAEHNPSSFTNLQSGTALPSEVRHGFENWMGHDFSAVRIHTGPSSERLAQSINAHAYTTGSDIVFDNGKYNPSTLEGQQLIAHELTHVVQQGAAPRKDGSTHSPTVRSSSPTSQRIDRKENTEAPVMSENEPGLIDRGIKFFSETADTVKDTVADTSSRVAIGLVEQFTPDLCPIIRCGPTRWIKDKITTGIKNFIGIIGRPLTTFGGFGPELKKYAIELLEWIQGAVARIAKNDCRPFAEALEKIQSVFNGLASPVIEKIASYVTSIETFVSGLWKRFGMPVWDFLKDIGGGIMETLQTTGDFIAYCFGRLKEYAGSAVAWVKEKLGIEDSTDDREGIVAWFKRKCSEVWNETIEPFIIKHKEPFMVIAGTLLYICPATQPFMVGGAAIIALVNGINMLRRAFASPKHFADNREETISFLDIIRGSCTLVGNTLVNAASTITGALLKISAGLAMVQENLQGSIFSFLGSIVGSISLRIQDLGVWAQKQLTPLTTWIERSMNGLAVSLEPIVAFLHEIGEVVLDVIKLPVMIAGKLWNKIPCCIRNPFVDFLLNQLFKRIPVLKQITESLPGIWAKIKGKAISILRMIFVHGDIGGAAHEIFSLLLRALDVPIDLALAILDKTESVFDKIMKDPAEFFYNLLRTLKGAFVKFGENILSHLAFGVKGWLFGAFSKAGVTLPAEWTFKSVFNLILQVLGITFEKVLERLEKKIGTPVFNKIRGALSTIGKIWDWINTLINEGVDGLWNRLTEKAGDLWQALIDGTIGWIEKKIVKEAIVKVATYLDPTGIMAVVNTIVGFYRSICTFMDHAREVMDITNNILDNMTEVIGGKVAKAAEKLENVFRRSLPFVLAFLARQVGLGKLSDSIKEIVETIQEKVVTALDWVIDKAWAIGGKLVGLVKAGVGKVLEWWKKKVPIKAKNEEHEIYFEGENEQFELIAASKNPKRFKSFLSDKKSEIEELLKMPPPPGKKPLPAKRKNELGKILNDVLPKLNGMATYLEKMCRSGKNKKAISESLGKDIAEYQTKIAAEIENAGLFDINAEEKICWPKSEIKFPSQENITIDLDLLALPKKTKEKYKNENMNCVLGKTMEAILSCKAGSETGSAPNTASKQQLIWKLVTEKPYNIERVVNGHLLNDNLYGPGKTMNLTPISKTLNKNHERYFEKPLKEAILTGPLVVLKYFVKARYDKNRKGIFQYLANAFEIKVQIGERKENTDGSLLEHWNFSDDQSKLKEKIPDLNLSNNSELNNNEAHFQ